MFMSPHTIVASGPAATISREGGKPGELVLVMLGIGHAPVGYVHGHDPDPVHVADTARASG